MHNYINTQWHALVLRVGFTLLRRDEFMRRERRYRCGLGFTLFGIDWLYPD